MSGFQNVVFPIDVSYGSAGGPAFNTEIIRTDNGAEQRFSRWENALQKYEVAYNVKSVEKMSELRNFFFARRGSFYSFKYVDHLDNNSTRIGTEYGNNIEVTPFDQLIDITDGSQTQFQLVKRYFDFGSTYVRPITKPLASSVRIALNGVEITSNFTVSETTGIITFNTPPTTGQEITAGYGFYVHVRFSKENDSFLNLRHDDFDTMSSGFNLEEVRDDVTTTSDSYKGGGQTITTGTSGTYSITEQEGRVVLVDTTAATQTINIVLPEVTVNTPSGGPYFYVVNGLQSGVAVDVYDGPQLLTTLDATRPVCQVDLINTTDNYYWIIAEGSGGA